MKGPSEKGELFAVLEYMKGGQVVTHPCAPPSKNRVLHPVPVPFPRAKNTAATCFSCFTACENIGVNLKFHVTNTFLYLHAFGNVVGG